MWAQGLTPLAGLVALAALLRFPTLGVQSFWFDEAVTVGLLERSFGSMLGAIPDSESAPPLYYVLAWGWSKLFGTGEAGVRSLSAVLGTATVPVAFAAGRALVSRRTGLFTAALVAVNPLLVWYSQEARAYSLLVFLTALSILFFAHALRDDRRRWLALWALASALALATHYFAIFLIGPEALLLLATARWSLAGRMARGPRPRLAGATGEKEAAGANCAPGRKGAGANGQAARPVMAAVAFVAATAAALVPLALAQRSHARYIADTPLVTRIAQIPKQYAIGFDAPLEAVTGILTGALVLLAAWLALTRSSRAEHTGAALAAALAGASVSLPIVLAGAGVDYLLTRNVLPALLPGIVALAAGFGARRAGGAGPLAACALCTVSVAVVVSVALEPRFQRDDWQGVAEALGPAKERRAVVVAPGTGATVLRLYLPDARPMRPGGVPVREVAAVGLSPSGTGSSDSPPRRQRKPFPPPLRPVRTLAAETFTIIRGRADAPVRYSGSQLAARRVGPGLSHAVLVETPPGD